jgi:hypothetical protein
MHSPGFQPRAGVRLANVRNHCEINLIGVLVLQQHLRPICGCRRTGGLRFLEDLAPYSRTYDEVLL